jgi:N-acetylneuraminate lyase
MNTAGLEVVAYNFPQMTGITFSKKNAFLNDPRVIGIKHTSMNLYDLERLKDVFPNKIIFNGYDEVFLYSLAAGADAAIGTTVNIFPKLFRAISDEFQKGGLLKAKDLQKKINNVIEVFISTGVFPAAKYSLELLGIDIGSCRKPFAPLTDESKNKIKKVLEEVKTWL